ncbi:MAG: serine/threonine protein phosphatase [Clostridium sp.]|jgi:predicted phosphohydrolase|nr:MAG: serine/threonine protein phosphatase [Clostridium sp.]
MSIYAISDLHLSFNTNKPMDIFGWNNYEEKISQDWRKNVKEEDLVLLTGDFSWEMKLENTYKDFQFINNLHGKKLLLKGNHDLWWTTLKRMREFLKEKEFNNIDFIYNNSYEFENYIIAGTRGWNLVSENIDDKKIKDRELLRLENSIIDGIRKYGEDKPIIVCMHYPPLLKELKNSEFTKILEKYNVKYCLYGHLHGKSHMNVFDGNYNNVAYKMVSCDYTGFKLIKII